MSTIFDYLILKTELSQSEAFGKFYDDIFDTNESTAFTTPFIDDVNELLNAIVLKYETLTDFQKEMLSKIFLEFNNIRTIIDPKRLKSFEHYFNNDDELLLYRETEHGLVNIIINPEDCIAFSFIPNIGDQRIFYFIDNEGDFEKLAYNFFSY